MAFYLLLLVFLDSGNEGGRPNFSLWAQFFDPMMGQ